MQMVASETNIDDIEPLIPQLLSRMMGLDDSRSSTNVGRMVVQLALDLIERRISPGEQLNSIELARRFGVSRTPVREVLVTLENEGLIEVPPRRRPRAAVASPERITNIYELRAELYGLVAHRAARIMSRDDLRVIEAIHGRMEASEEGQDGRQYFWYNVLYHDHLASSVGNETLKRAIDGLGVTVLQLRNRNMRSEEHRRRSCRDHGRLTMAIRDGDEVLASAMARSLVLAGLKRLRVNDDAAERSDEATS